MTLMANRIVVGVWAEWPPGFSWAHEGMTRLLGFMIQGASKSGAVTFRVVLPAHVRSEAATDFAALGCVEGQDYTLESPPDGSGDLDDLVVFANAAVSVEGWLILFPHFSRGTRLAGRKATIFPDAIPRLFPNFGLGAWDEEGDHTVLMRKVAETLSASDALVTFSKHVARDQAHRLFHYPEERIHVVPHALPDLAGDLPVDNPRRGTTISRRTAAEFLRSHAQERGLRYLSTFPFEEASYVVVSTQDRMTKNITSAAKAVLDVLRRQRKDIKLITTAPLHFGAEWTELPGLIEREQAPLDVVSFTRLPRREHAALYHCAALAVHPSFFEGGRGPFPMSEALSVGTPCLFARGPHVDELLEEAPELRIDTFDPYAPLELAHLLADRLTDRNTMLDRQSPILERLIAQRSWADVALEYALAASGRAGPRLQ